MKELQVRLGAGQDRQGTERQIVNPAGALAATHDQQNGAAWMQS